MTTPPHSLITSWHVGTEEVCLELIWWETAQTTAAQPFDMELQKSEYFHRINWNLGKWRRDRKEPNVT